MAILTWLGVPGDADKWKALGFEVTDGIVRVGHVDCAIATPVAWGFDALHAEAGRLGVETRTVSQPIDAGGHPNGIDHIDHIVYAVADLDDAVNAMTAVMGEPPRRRFFPRGESGPEMAFFTTGEAFVEVVASGGPPALWGIAFSSPDLDATVEVIRAGGGPIGDPKPAVQGGRIASVWKGHVDWGIAIMEPSAR